MSTPKRIKSAIVLALPKAGKTSLWLFKIILPISLGVSFLQYFGIIDIIAHYLSPIFSVVGLPGEAAVVFITSIFMSLYAPIAIIATLPLSPRDITILALMCLIAHNMIVETAVQSKTGSNYAVMFLLRIFAAFATAYVLNRLLPVTVGHAHASETAVVYHSLGEMLKGWGVNTFWLIVKVLLIITGLMVLQSILNEFKVLDLISKPLSPLMALMGIPKNCTFLFLVAHILGLTYGSAIMIESVNNNELTKEDANLLNYHIAVNHSTLEDTSLFAAIGVPILWMIVTRFILAFVVVWFVRFLQYTFNHSKSNVPVKAEEEKVKNSQMFNRRLKH
jgi:hypothetical protein